MKKLAMIAGLTLVLGTTLAKADDLFEPGSYENPYVIEQNFLTGEIEIKSKYPTGSFEPGSYENPYIIEQDPLTGEIQIRSKYPYFDDEDW